MGVAWGEVIGRAPAGHQVCRSGAQVRCTGSGNHMIIHTLWASPVLHTRQAHEPRQERKTGEPPEIVVSNASWHLASADPSSRGITCKTAGWPSVGTGVATANRRPRNGQIWPSEAIPGMALAPEGFGADTHVNAAGSTKHRPRDGSKSLGFSPRSCLYNLQLARRRRRPYSCFLCSLALIYTRGCLYSLGLFSLFPRHYRLSRVIPPSFLLHHVENLHYQRRRVA